MARHPIASRKTVKKWGLRQCIRLLFGALLPGVLRFLMNIRIDPLAQEGIACPIILGRSIGCISK
jgi:hypothetical protein